MAGSNDDSDFSDLSDWDENILDEIDQAEEILDDAFETEHQINFVSDEFVESVKVNVPDSIVNLTNPKVKAKHKKAQTSKKRKTSKDTLPMFSTALMQRSVYL